MKQRLFPQVRVIASPPDTPPSVERRVQRKLRLEQRLCSSPYAHHLYALGPSPLSAHPLGRYPLGSYPFSWRVDV